MERCQHDYVYGGLLNIFDGEILLKVIEYWKCRRCGIIRASFRTMDTVSSTYGMLPEPTSVEERWIVLICGYKKDAELYSIKIGDEILHGCRGGEIKLHVYEGWKIKSIDGEEVVGHYSFLLEEVTAGYIDLSREPLKIVGVRH
ncbi:MAG: hypothetical protein ABDH32_02630 [Candidatus Caldarchaeales archaeon]